MHPVAAAVSNSSHALQVEGVRYAHHTAGCCPGRCRPRLARSWPGSGGTPSGPSPSRSAWHMPRFRTWGCSPSSRCCLTVPPAAGCASGCCSPGCQRGRRGRDMQRKQGAEVFFRPDWPSCCDRYSCQAQHFTVEALGLPGWCTCAPSAGGSALRVCSPQAAARQGSLPRCAWCLLSPRRPWAAPQLPRRTSVSAMWLPPAPTAPALHCCQWASLPAAVEFCDFYCFQTRCAANLLRD